MTRTARICHLINIRLVFFGRLLREYEIEYLLEDGLNQNQATFR